jgi:hypothetical protein
VNAFPFSTLKGTIWLHKYCHINTVALHLNSEPKYAPTELLAKFKSNHHVMANAGITPYYCFDGFCHPMKKVAHGEQHKNYKITRQWLDSFYDDAWNNCPINDTRRQAAMKFLQDITIPDPLVVSYIAC